MNVAEIFGFTGLEDDVLKQRPELVPGIEPDDDGGILLAGDQRVDAESTFAVGRAAGDHAVNGVKDDGLPILGLEFDVGPRLALGIDEATTDRAPGLKRDRGPLGLVATGHEKTDEMFVGLSECHVRGRIGLSREIEKTLESASLPHHRRSPRSRVRHRGQERSL